MLRNTRRQFFRDILQYLIDNSRSAKGFSLSWDDSLKKIPAGFDADDEFSEYYKLKSFLIEKPIDESYILESNFVDKVVSDLRRTYEFNSLLNKAVEYAMEMYWFSDNCLYYNNLNNLLLFPKTE